MSLSADASTNQRQPTIFSACLISVSLDDSSSGTHRFLIGTLYTDVMYISYSCSFDPTHENAEHDNRYIVLSTIVPIQASIGDYRMVTRKVERSRCSYCWM